MTKLPIEDVIPELLATLKSQGVAVLQAPPGAGKTTRVPLALLEAGAILGRLVMLEPRRLAARAAAERMAETLGEEVGQTVGYRMRGDSKTSKATRIEVVTEGVLTRMIQSDPGLEGIGTVVFDEFHERSLNGDLGLALVCEARAALSEDLQVLVMSATLDAAPVAEMLGARVITSDGRAYPVETHWLPKPLPRASRPFERARNFTRNTCDLVEQAFAAHEGGVLVFLPGAREIRDVQAALKLEAQVMPLYGALPFAEQRRAVLPGSPRKVVLATSIAETSLTIEDIRVVVDAGRARRARFNAGSGMSQLVTEPVSRAEADQRRGRAGRVAEGVCYRMWAKAEEGALPAFPLAEIEATDLAPLALELAAWGARPEDLSFLTAPPQTAYDAAREVLRSLGALDPAGGISEHGRAVAKLPLHPRLAHMLLRAGSGAAELAALLSGRDMPDRGQSDVVLHLRDASGETRREAKRLARFAPADVGLSVGEQAALAYPDRIGLRRPGEAPRYILSGGRGAALAEGDALAGARLIAALRVEDAGREGRISQAAQLSEGELRALYGAEITWTNVCDWDARQRQVVARRREVFGALVLAEQIWQDAPEERISAALMEGVRALGLGCLDWSKPARLLRARVVACHSAEGMPDWSDQGLLDSLEDWLAPFAAGIRTAAALKGVNLAEALRAALSWDAAQSLARLAPARYTTPLGRDVAIDYAGDVPAIELRLQEMFGVVRHPEIAGQALKITLLSPAGRPVQVTQDLPGFWASSYADVRRDMRGRYPRHPWPEDPTEAAPTVRAKPRGK